MAAAGKAFSLFIDVLARVGELERAIQQVQQSGAVSTDPRMAAVDTAITAALTAINALK